MPYSAPAPRMINPAIGLHNLVARAGHNAGYDIDLTLFDAPDHRMIRRGVLLAHRVLDGAASGISVRRTGFRCCPRSGSSRWGKATCRRSWPT